MKQLITEELPYQIDSSSIFEAFLDAELPIYLDSSASYSSRGRYDIITANPISIINSKSSSYKDNVNHFIELKNTLAELLPSLDNDYHLPFIGGAAGYFGYDLGRQLETIQTKTKNDLNLNDGITGIFNWAIIIDHRQQRSLLACHPNIDQQQLVDIRKRLKSVAKNHDNFQLTSPFLSNLSKQNYSEAFNKIQDYITAGDCYQINLAQRFTANFEGSSWAAYKQLRQVAAAPFSSYIGINKDSSILSMSPERFLHVGNQRVTTSPIKGTIERGNTLEKDAELGQRLLSSSKDRAENLMIVDLLRNDLGKSCRPGSIQVDELFELQTFETVHHLVSTISGRLKSNIHPIDLLASCFPGGSITGTPKVRAMEIIEELEPHRRSIYCGSIGYISCDGQMDTNIAIRTMLTENNNIHCWAGGGIVADSQCESEYQECFTKVKKLMETLE